MVDPIHDWPNPNKEEGEMTAEYEAKVKKSKAAAAKNREVAVRSPGGELVTGDLVRSKEEIIAQTPNEVSQRYITDVVKVTRDASVRGAQLKVAKLKDLEGAEHALSELMIKFREITERKSLVEYIPIFGSRLRKSIDENKSNEECIQEVMKEFNRAREKMMGGIADFRTTQEEAQEGNAMLAQNVPIMERELEVVKEELSAAPESDFRLRNHLGALILHYEKGIASAESIQFVNMSTAKECGVQAMTRQELALSMATEGPVAESLVRQQLAMMATNRETERTARKFHALREFINKLLVMNAKETAENMVEVAKLSSRTMLTEQTITETMGHFEEMSKKFHDVIKESRKSNERVREAAEKAMQQLLTSDYDCVPAIEKTEPQGRIGFTRK